MTADDWNLALGLVGWVIWAGWLVLAVRGRRSSPVEVACIVIAFGAMQITLIFGSLRLLGMVDGETWLVTGTATRVAVVLTGVVAILARRLP
jgi:hypothetical protein